MVTTPVLYPVTMPDELTVAMVGVLLLHVPPEGLPVNVIVEPMQTELLPEMVGVGFTTIARVTYEVPTI